MRVDNVNQSKKIGYIKFNTDAEIDLIGESLDILIAKQQELVKKEGAKDKENVERLERLKTSKDRVIEIPKQHKMMMKNMRDKVKEKKEKEKDIEDTEEFKTMAKNIAASEIDSGLREGTEITYQNIQIISTALNEHIADMEQSGLYKRTNRNRTKYAKLQQLLALAQEQKSKFVRVRPKPKNWGRLRR